MPKLNIKKVFAICREKFCSINGAHAEHIASFRALLFIHQSNSNDRLKLAPVGMQRMPVIMRRVTAARKSAKLFHTIPPSLCNSPVGSAINLLCPILTSPLPRSASESRTPAYPPARRLASARWTAPLQVKDWTRIPAGPGLTIYPLDGSHPEIPTPVTWPPLSHWLGWRIRRPMKEL